MPERVLYSELKNPTPPQWTCEQWDEVYEAYGKRICTQHDRELTIVALDGVSRLCRVGAQRDSYEFLAMIHRDMDIRMGRTTPILFWNHDSEGSEDGN